MDFYLLQDKLLGEVDKKSQRRQKKEHQGAPRKFKVNHFSVTYTPYDRHSKSYKKLQKHLDNIENKKLEDEEDEDDADCQNQEDYDSDASNDIEDYPTYPGNNIQQHYNQNFSRKRKATEELNNRNKRQRLDEISILDKEILILQQKKQELLNVSNIY